MEKESVKKFDLEAAFKALDEIEIPKATGLKANRVNLRERFNQKPAYDALVEDYFDVTSQEDLNDAQENREAEVAQAKLARIEKIVDLDATSPDELLPSYVGKVIIQCPQCMTLFYKNPADIEESEENPDVVNINEICQHCGNASGYTVIGKVGAVDDSEMDQYTTEPAEAPTEVPAEDESKFSLEEPENGEEEPAEETAGEPAEEENSEEDLDIDLEEIPEEESEEEPEEEKKEESLNLSKEAKSKYETEHKSENLTLNEEAGDETDAEDIENRKKYLDELDANATIVNYAEYKHSYCHALEPYLRKINYFANVLKKPANYVKAMVRNIIINSPEVRWTDKEQWFMSKLKEFWPDSHELYRFIKNSIRRAHDILVYVDADGELIPELNADMVSIPADKLFEGLKEAKKKHKITDVYDAGLELEGFLEDSYNVTIGNDTDFDGKSFKVVIEGTEGVDFPDNLEEIINDWKDDNDIYLDFWYDSYDDHYNIFISQLKETKLPNISSKKKKAIIHKIWNNIVKMDNSEVFENPCFEIDFVSEDDADEDLNDVHLLHSDGYYNDIDEAVNSFVDYWIPEGNDRELGGEAAKAYLVFDASADSSEEANENGYFDYDNVIICQYDYRTGELKSYYSIYESLKEDTHKKFAIELPLKNGEKAYRYFDTKEEAEAWKKKFDMGKVVEVNESLKEDTSAEIDAIIASWGINEGCEKNVDKEPLTEDEDIDVDDPDNIKGIIQEWEDATIDDENTLADKPVVNDIDQTQVNKDDELAHVFDAWESLKKNVEDLDEESLNKRINEYLQEVYSNVKLYETTDCVLKNDKLIIEGKITFNSGKTKLTTFEFLPAYRNNKLIFEGYNKDFAKNKAFTLNCSVTKSKKLITESLHYRYRINKNLVEGLK